MNFLRSPFVLRAVNLLLLFGNLFLCWKYKCIQATGKKDAQAPEKLVIAENLSGNDATSRSNAAVNNGENGMEIVQPYVKLPAQAKEILQRMAVMDMFTGKLYSEVMRLFDLNGDELQLLETIVKNAIADLKGLEKMHSQRIDSPEGPCIQIEPFYNSGGSVLKDRIKNDIAVVLGEEKSDVLLAMISRGFLDFGQFDYQVWYEMGAATDSNPFVQIGISVNSDGAKMKTSLVSRRLEDVRFRFENILK